MEIALMNDDAINPTRASKGSAGLDLYSNIDVDIDINSIKKVNTGISESLPENTYGSIRDKSSLAAKRILTLGGVIDNDFTEEIIVIMTSLIEPIKIKKGQKIAQLIVSSISYPEIKLVKSLKETERNDKGFGKMDKIDLDKELDKINRLSEKEVDEIFENFNLNYKRASNLLLNKTHHDKVECKARRSSTLIAS